MTKEELKNRTKQFALKIIRLVEDLPNTKAGNTIGNQIIRSGHQLQQTIVLLAEPGAVQILFQK